MCTHTGTLRVIGMTGVRIAISAEFTNAEQPRVVPAGDTKFYRSPFFRDFWHLNVAMMTSNNALVPDPDKEDILASKPFDWPFLHLGLRMCGWGADLVKFYLVGTPVIWWGSTISLGVAVATLVVYLFRAQRKYVDMDARKSRHTRGCCTLV